MSQPRSRRASRRTRQPSLGGAGRLGEIQAALNSGWSAPVARLIGFSVTRIDRSRCRVELVAGGRHANPMGTLHGGVICDIADAAMGMAYASRLSSSESFTTIELKINFLRPFWTGRLIADGSVIRKGRSSGLVACRIRDDAGRMVAFATSTCWTLPASKRGTLAREPGPVRAPRPVSPRTQRRLSRASHEG